MQYIDDIYKAVTFIENNFKNDITVQDAAYEVCYSLFHFSRIFSEITGHSPYDYIMRRRLSEAAKDLLNTNSKVIDIALDYRFNSPETFSRAFKKMFQVMPAKIKKDKSINTFLLKNKSSREYLVYLNGVSKMKPAVIELDSLHLIGISSQITDRKPQSPELWRIFLQQIKQTVSPVQIEKYYACLTYFNDRRKNNIFYMPAFDVPAVTDSPLSFVQKKIPSGKYAVFTHKQGLDTIDMIYDFIFQTWLPKSRYRSAAPFVLEVFDSKSYGEDDITGIAVYIPVI